MIPEAPETEEEEDFLITSDDAYRSGYCAKGLYRWLISNDFDIRKAMREGVRFSEIKAVDDAFSQSIVAYVRRRKKAESAQ